VNEGKCQRTAAYDAPAQGCSTRPVAGRSRAPLHRRSAIRATSSTTATATGRRRAAQPG